ncbi:MAG TPA: GDP-L-fucose synthase [Gemmata sp.]|nr:GDP-L-fucose synthase [Gemmata sp.]
MRDRDDVEVFQTCQVAAMSHLTGKTVLVTGGGGFLGRHLCDRLRGIAPKSLVTPRKNDYDLTEQGQVRELLAAVRPETVIHLAAVVGGIGANQANPGRYFYENALMGLLLMEEARRVGVSKFVSVGTICSYPKFTPVPFKEEAIWDGYPEETNAPYGIAKKLLLVQAGAYRQQYGFNAITLLPVNLYGPGDNFDPISSHVIPALIRKVVAAKVEGKQFIEAWGTGSASREFLFVQDAVEAIVRATDLYEKPDPVNVGSGNEITIRELTTTICELCGFKGEVRWDPTKPDGQPRRCLDTTRAREEFGFVSRTNLRAGLAETIKWYESARHKVEGSNPPMQSDLEGYPCDRVNLHH